MAPHNLYSSKHITFNKSLTRKLLKFSNADTLWGREEAGGIGRGGHMGGFCFLNLVVNHRGDFHFLWTVNDNVNCAL